MTFFISLLAGYFTGFLISIPPGPINFVVFESGLKKIKKNYLLVALGGGTGDFLYTLIAIFWRISQEYVKFLKLFFTLSVGIFLLIMSYFYFKNSFQIDELEKKVENRSEKYNPYLKGFLFSVANLLFLITMIAIVELYFSIGVIKLSIFSGFLFAMGIFLGTFSWLSIVGLISHKVFNITSLSQNRVKKIITILFLFLGLYFIGKFIVILCKFYFC